MLYLFAAQIALGNILDPVVMNAKMHLEKEVFKEKTPTNPSANGELKN